MPKSTHQAGTWCARLAAVIVCGLLVIVGASSARAHDQLLRTTPAANSVAPAPPQVLIMQFSQAPIAGTAHVVAADHTGTTVRVGQARIVNQAVIADWPPHPAGTYRVGWRVTSSDGHPISGTWDFSYGVAVPQGMATAADSTPGTSIWLWAGGGLVVVFALVVVGYVTRKTRGNV